MHVITRVSHPLRYRRLHVRDVAPLSRRMRRMHLVGDDLAGFTTAAFDDHVKVFVPGDDGRLPEPVVGERSLSFPGVEGPPPGRDFTVRHHDERQGVLTLDMGVYGPGPASRWAADARPGSVIGVAGPRGSGVISDTFDWYLLIGDEAALPAIARAVETLPASRRVVVIAEVDGSEDEQPITTRDGLDVRWIHRSATREALLPAVVADLALPAGQGFAWVAGEATLARAVRRVLIDGHHLDARWIKASAYWRQGAAGRHEVLTDE